MTEAVGVTLSPQNKENKFIAEGTGGIFHCEDEPMQLEWGRLGELSRRNTMCPSHLKTSYPVETQRYNPIRFQEDALRASTIDNQTVINCDQQPGSGRKRKQGWDSNDSGSDSADSKTSKQVGSCNDYIDTLIESNVCCKSPQKEHPVKPCLCTHTRPFISPIKPLSMRV